MKKASFFFLFALSLSSFGNKANAQCPSGYSYERTRIFHDAPKRRLARGKSRNGRVCLKVIKPALRRTRRLYFRSNGRDVEVETGVCPRGVECFWRTRSRKDQIVCSRTTKIERTRVFHNAPKRRLVRGKMLRIHVPGRAITGRVWVSIYSSHNGGRNFLYRAEITNSKSYTCLDVRRPSR